MNKKVFLTITSLIGLGLCIYGIYKYAAFSNPTKTYHSNFTKISGLQESGPVLVNGVKVGNVSDIYLRKDKNIHVSYEISDALTIPKGTVAKVMNADVSGTKAVTLLLSNSRSFLKEGDYITAIPDTNFVEMINAKITPIINNSLFLIHTSDSILSHVNYMVRHGGWGAKVQQDIHLFKKDFQDFSDISTKAVHYTASLSNFLGKLNTTLSNSQEKNATINKTIHNAVQKTHSLSTTPYDTILGNTITATHTFSQNIKPLDTHSLFNDKTPYLEANKTVENIHRSMKALKENPPGIQLIGGGNEN